MAKITLPAYKCERCGHPWASKKQTDPEPTVCPTCKSPYWNKPRKQKKPQDLSKGLHDALAKVTKKEK